MAVAMASSRALRTTGFLIVDRAWSNTIPQLVQRPVSGGNRSQRET